MDDKNQILKQRKIFLEELPKKKHGNEFRIIWKECIGYKVKFIYYDVEGWLEIINHDSLNSTLTIRYNGKDSIIRTNRFSICGIGKILGNNNIYKFKYKIGQIFKDEKRDITIIDMEYRSNNDNSTTHGKWYKYRCNKDGYEGWTSEYNLKVRNGCPVCANKILILGINTIWDTDRWMCDLGVSEEDAKTHSFGSGDKIYPTCPHCGKKREKPIAITTIYQTHSIACDCTDNVKYPNKFALKMLKQLKLEFKTEYSPEWINPLRYDFYIPSMNLIIEMDGGLGHGKRDNKMNGTTKEESKAIDDYKDEQAKLHNIEVIRIDCDYEYNNRFEYIKYNILKSKLNNILYLTIVDWDKCDEFASSNLIKVACDYKKNNSNITSIEIANAMGYHCGTIISWLKEGSKHGWCEYDGKLEMIKNGKNCGEKLKDKLIKHIEIFKDGISLGVYESAKQIEEQSERLFWN